MSESEFTAAFFVKIGVLTAILLGLPVKQALVASLALIICYRYVIAKALGLKVMDAMDLNTFSTNDKAVVNSLSMTIVSQSNKEHANGCFGMLAKTHIKMRSKIVKIFGDLYYKEIPIEEAMNACLEFLPPQTIKNKADLEDFTGRELGKVFALNRPQWHVFVQQNYDGEKALVIFKNHHSLCDGISGMGLTLQCDDTFDPSKVLKAGRINVC